ncbi:hypothetical protein COO91_03334 [Nostoc flagelliforme CCNUN1]|uniref:Uncharacterized protein n=1 Tax=Nostoc flagelliforme CCNUN1 TaxID=2038116 RepID=A0A2K8SPL1_9NOSO|nr:hypothetical protein COO91_03334 [Nostoc flagelliforme CCNUN1]
MQRNTIPAPCPPCTERSRSMPAASFNERYIYFRHFVLGHFAASINIVYKKG